MVLESSWLDMKVFSFKHGNEDLDYKDEEKRDFIDVKSPSWWVSCSIRSWIWFLGSYFYPDHRSWLDFYRVPINLKNPN